MFNLLDYTNETHLFVFVVVVLIAWAASTWLGMATRRDLERKLVNSLKSGIDLVKDNAHLQLELFSAKQQIIKLMATSKDVTDKAEALIEAVDTSLQLDEVKETVFFNDMPDVDPDEPIDVAEVFDRDYVGWVNGDVTLKSKIEDRRAGLSIVKDCDSD